MAAPATLDIVFPQRTNAMPVLCVGLSHRTAPLPVRERLAFGREELRAALSPKQLGQLRSAGIAELCIVSTCNRTELYAAARSPRLRYSAVPEFLAEFLVRARGIEPDLVRASLYGHAGVAAIRHLCRVAAGLDSMILGEAEILGQLSAAHQRSAESGASGPILEAAFTTAIRAGRRARAETGIGRNPLSAASEAVRLVRECAPASAPILLVGTGEVARVLGQVLRSKGYGNLTVSGRTGERSAALAEAIGGRTRPWHELGAALREAEVVLTSTAAPHAVLTRELVQPALARREPGRWLTFVDLAVPRDVEPAVAELPGVRVHNLDTLQERLTGNLADRREQIPLVEAIIEEEVREFQAWRRGAEFKPVLAAMHARAEAIRQQEIERMARKLAGKDPDVRRQVEALSRALVSKLLHEPSVRLRNEADPARSRLYAGAIRDLFALEVDSRDEEPEQEIA